MNAALSWLFAPAPKAQGSFDRSAPLSATIAALPRLRERFGITRIGDTTRLDKIGLPTFCAIVPDSPDGISVYSGKGPTREHALCSAVMEAVERQVGATCQLPYRMSRPSAIGDTVDLRTMGMLEAAFHREIPFVAGTDLLGGNPTWVPLAAVRCPWYGESVLRWSSTHGLASGNSLLEAIYHALFELVERHVWSVVHTKAHVRPRLLLEALARIAELPFNPSEMVDGAVAREVRQPTGVAALDGLVEAITRAGLIVQLRALEECHLPIVMSACIHEAGGAAGLGVCHGGYGASWSPAHAAIRAVTEAAQSRIVDIQGAREDVLRPTDPAGPFGTHPRRRTSLPHGRWFFDAPAELVDLCDLPDRSNGDLAAELRLLLQSLETMGVRQIAAIDISPADMPVHVVRLIAPDLETTTVDGRIGPTIRRLLVENP